MILNIDPPTQAEALPAILRLGFRPFFLAGAALAALALPIWLFSLYSPQNMWLKTMPFWWHPHELLFGFGMAIVAGFLLTAVQTWTNQPGMKGLNLAITVICWLLARLLLLMPFSLPLWLPAVFDSAFLLLSAAQLWRSIVKVKQWRNIAFPLLFILACAVNLLSYWALAKHDFLLASRIWEAMIWWLALMITVVGGRVIAFFTAIRLKETKPAPIVWLDRIIIAGMFILVLQAINAGLATRVEQVLLASIGLLQLVRCSRWLPLKTFRQPMLWSLHLSYLCLPVTMLSLAWFKDDPYAARQLFHLLSIGCIGGMCLSMMSRVSLGHTSRNIYEGPMMAPAFVLILAAALIRSILPIMAPEYTHWWHWLSGGAWTIAFSLFVLHYTLVLSQPRIDGRPG